MGNLLIYDLTDPKKGPRFVNLYIIKVCNIRSPRSVSEQYQKKYPSGQHYIEIIIICQVNSVKKVQNLLILY